MLAEGRFGSSAQRVRRLEETDLKGVLGMGRSRGSEVRKGEASSGRKSDTKNEEESGEGGG